jgi:hypothetical protein
MALTLCPALLVLTSPLIGGTIYQRSSRVMMLDWPYVVAMALQAVIAGILLVGASRKYRRDDAAALPATLSLLLLAAWVVTSIVGIAEWGQFTGSFWQNMDAGLHTQFLWTLAISILLTLFPVGAAARAEGEWRRHRRHKGDPALMRRPMPVILAVLLSAGIVMGLLYVAPEPNSSWSKTAGRMAITNTLFLLSTSYLLRIVNRIRSRRLVVVGIWVVLNWVGPFVIDLARHGASADPEDEFLTRISTCSPLGTLIQLWDRRPLDTALGLTVQAGLVAFTALLFYTTRSRANAMAAPGFPVVYPRVSK